MLGQLDQMDIEKVLKKGVVGRLGCCVNNRPYIVPISYAFDGKSIYCHMEEGKKAGMMRQNPFVCFQVDEMRNMANWKSVLIEGIYEEITSKEDRNDAMKILLNRYLPIISSVTVHLGEHWPFYPDDTASIAGIVFRICITSMSGRFERDPSSPIMQG